MLSRIGCPVARGAALRTTTASPADSPAVISMCCGVACPMVTGLLVTVSSAPSPRFTTNTVGWGAFSAIAIADLGKTIARSPASVGSLTRANRPLPSRPHRRGCGGGAVCAETALGSGRRICVHPPMPTKRAIAPIPSSTPTCLSCKRRQ